MRKEGGRKNEWGETNTRRWKEKTMKETLRTGYHKNTTKEEGTKNLRARISTADEPAREGGGGYT